MLGSITHPDAAVRAQGGRSPARVRRDRDRARLHGAVAVAGRRHQLRRPGRPARAPAADARVACRQVYAELPAEQELLVEYKFFEPGFYATDFADWGSSLLICQKLGERAKVLVDIGHHAQGTNIEQIVAILDERGPPRRLPLQQPQVRRRRPDRRLGEPVRAVPRLLRADRGGAAAAAADDRPVAQRRAQGRGDGAERGQHPGGLRQGAARRPRRRSPPTRPTATSSAATRSCSTRSGPTCGHCAHACARRRARPRIRCARCARAATPSAWRASAGDRSRRPAAGAAEQRPKLVEHPHGPLLDVAERVTAELVAARAGLALAPPVDLPRMA